MDDDRKRLVNLRRRVNRARDFPHNTCPASRHLRMIADTLASGKPYPMLHEEPGHCAETMYSVLESLWRLRADCTCEKGTKKWRKRAERAMARAVKRLERDRGNG